MLRLIRFFLCLLCVVALCGCGRTAGALPEAATAPTTTLTAAPSVALATTPSSAATPAPTTDPATPTPAPTAPTPMPTSRVIPDYSKYVEINDKEIFTEAEMYELPLRLYMPRDEVIAWLGVPLLSENIPNEASGDVMLGDTYENGNEILYLLREGEYRLFIATIVAEGQQGPRGLTLGDSMEDVIGAFSCQYDDLVTERKRTSQSEPGGYYPFTILYGVLPPMFGSVYPYPPFGVIAEDNGYFLRWEFYREEGVQTIQYVFLDEESLLYQMLLNEEIDYIGLFRPYCKFLVRDGFVFAMEWGIMLSAA